MQITERGKAMKRINGRTFSWMIFGGFIVLTVVLFFFLPETIPMHFTKGEIDDVVNKKEIFLFPMIQLVILVLTANQKIKYMLTHSRTVLSDVQYNWIVNGLCFFVAMMEGYIVWRAF